MSETVLELAMRTAIRDAYDDAAAVVRSSTATSLPQSELDALSDAIVERSKSRPKGPQEWWAGAQSDVNALREVDEKLLLAITNLPAHATVVTALLHRLLELAPLLPGPDLVKIPLMKAAEDALREAER